MSASSWTLQKRGASFCGKVRLRAKGANGKLFGMLRRRTLLMHFSPTARFRISKEEEEDEAPDVAEGVRNRAWVRGFSLQGIPLARKPFPVLDGALRRERPFPEERL